MAFIKGKNLKELAENVAQVIWKGGYSVPETGRDIKDLEVAIAKTIREMAKGAPEDTAFEKGFGEIVGGETRDAISDAAGYFFNPRAYLENKLKGLGDDEGALSDEQLVEKLNILEQLGSETRGVYTGDSVPTYQTRVDPMGTTLSEIELRGPGSRVNVAPMDVSSDRDRIRQLLEDREQRRVSEQELDQFIASLPEELARGREGFLGSELERASQYFTEELDPQIKQNLNVRGLLFSGDLPSELARGASGLFGAVQSQEAALREQDDLYFQNAAYQATLRKEIEAGADITSRLAFERGQARTRQERTFQSTQAELSRQFGEQAFARQQERSLAQQKRELERQRRAQEDANRNALVSNIGQTVGQIGGTIIGSKLASKNVQPGGVTT